ncbi:cupin domain-containing protein [Pseudogracilibacillus sp. SE30717A]|uniref:cupin domain-containing protein n=1 Tax=Pseudogracilibacillus sp. SE30717A TaxID=3098293 RepID=UPI00300DFA9B
MESVYKKIKELRTKNKITLAELSEKTGLSISFLSRIEKGTTNLAITSLKKIADAYGISMNYFFAEETRNSYIKKKADQQMVKIDGIDEKLIRLNGEFTGREMDPYFITVLPNKISSQKSFTHHGEEFYYVLAGTITFIIDGEDYEVHKGESIHFPSHLPHNFENRTDQDVDMINVVTPKLL